MRVLLAAEGDSDEIVAEQILRDTLKVTGVVRKKFPSRGFPVVQRSIDTLVRAAHYQLFDLLVIHFDLNDSLPPDWRKVSDSPRWCDVGSKIQRVCARLTSANRQQELVTVLMTPCKSTDAWLAWGRDNEDGRSWEAKDRHLLKRQLFGNPPRGLREKSRRLCEHLLLQMQSDSPWPKTLAQYVDDLKATR